jgi:protein-S-isoprenylcysteine O-methyltransferase Ste14
MTVGRTRFPALGPRGEGWVAAQIVLFVIIVGFGVRELGAHPPDGGPRLAVVAVGLALAVLGMLVAIRAIRDLGRSRSPFPRPLRGAALIETGQYGRVRHPIYSGLLVAAAGWSLATASPWAAAASVVLFGVLDAKARREEAWLVELHPGYAAYRTRTKRFIPAVY